MSRIQVGDEHDRAFEHGDQQQVVSVDTGARAVVLTDLSSELRDAGLDLIFAQQD